ncbi:unnamed protein product [Lasius platythorax]|uniref:Uncharacterized protein n=1 Tax=Lasius platythorax TaxID=488582 RepID=A0AAV2N111_9HYME
MARDYRIIKKKTWASAVVTEVLGSRTYLVKLQTGKVWKRHLDQLIAAAHNNDCTPNLRNELDVSTNETDNRILTVISYKDDNTPQPALPAIQNYILKPKQNIANQSISSSNNRDNTVATSNNKRISRLPMLIAGNFRSSRLRKKSERYSPN